MLRSIVNAFQSYCILKAAHKIHGGQRVDSYVKLSHTVNLILSILIRKGDTIQKICDRL